MTADSLKARNVLCLSGPATLTFSASAISWSGFSAGGACEVVQRISIQCYSMHAIGK